MTVDLHDFLWSESVFNGFGLVQHDNDLDKLQFNRSILLNRSITTQPNKDCYGPG